ncbi:hypothetical protein ABPG73_011325 [Tetrahymena malaccensis]
MDFEMPTNQVYYNFHDQNSNLKELTSLLISEKILNQSYQIQIESSDFKNHLGDTYHAKFELQFFPTRSVSFTIQDQSERIFNLTLDQSIQSFTILQIIDQPQLNYTILSRENEESIQNYFNINGFKLFINTNNKQQKQSNSYLSINQSFLRLLQGCNSQQYFHPIYQRCESCHERCKGCTGYKQCKDCIVAPGGTQRYDQLADGFCDYCPNGQTWKPNNICNGCSVSCNCDSSKKQCISCKDSKNQLNVERNTCEPCNEDEGYYIDGQYCKKCNIICKTCQGPSEYDCKDCIDGAKKYQDGSCKYNKDNPNGCILPYINQQNSCVCNQDGYYLKDKNCVQCQVDLKCQRCSPETSCTQCFQTKPEKYLQDGKKCTECKQSGYFINSNQITCDKCISNCDQCDNNSSCKKCNTGFYILEDNQSCSQCNTNGYYIDKTNQFCKKCPQDKNCKQCNNNQKCTECQNGYYLFNLDSCILCGDGYFKSGNNCFKCIDNCQTCADDKKCIKCLPNYYLFNDKVQCIPCNLEGQFQQSDTCQLCDSTCSKCQGKTQNDCLECKDQHQFNYKGRCEACARDGVFQSGKQCLDCAQNCKSCTGVEIDKCIQCNNTFSFQSDRKCMICPTDNKYFIDGNNQCLKCHDTCQTCSDEKETSCKTCIDNFKLDKDDRKCKSCNTNNGFFVNSQNECEKCHSTCKQCTGALETNCKECNQGLSFFNGKCQKCDTENSYYIDNKNQCVNCDVSCKTCSSKDVCIKCIDGMSFISDQSSKLCAKCSLDNMYVEDPQGKNICKNCHINCIGCKGPTISDCIKCKQPFSFNPQDKSCITCNMEADRKYIDDNNYCQSCDDKCKTCTGPGNGNCKLCKEGLYFNDNNFCEQCPPEKYYITDYKYCKKCNDSCLTCNGSQDNNCLSCIKDLALHENNTCKQCQTDNGFYVDIEKGIKVCKRCDTSCKTCHGQNNNQCDSCINSSFFIDGDTKICQTCQTENNYFQDGFYCKKCHDSCKKCNKQDALSCLQCAQFPIKLYFKDGLCQKCEESEGYYIKDDQISCEKCESSCKTCFGGQSNQCKTCQQNKYLYPNNTCKECEINNKFFISGISCFPCNNECQTCSGQSQDQCLSCPINKFLLSENGKKTCVDCLPAQSFYQNGNQCMRCDSSCLECNDSSKTSCTKCRDTDFLFEDGTCQSDCQLNGYFKEGKKCKKCDSSCKQCKGQGKNDCLLCNGEQKLYPEGYCSDCQINNKYFIKGQLCLPCHETCKTCQNSYETGCLDCEANLSKQADQTCKVCDLNNGMFVDQTDKICKKCDETCQTCSGQSELNCQTCKGNRKFYQDKNSTQKKCIQCQIENKRFIKEDNCLDCHAKCQTCSGASDIECLTCDEQYLMHEDKKCKTCDISNGFYIQDKNCLKCSEGCQICNKDGCQKCTGNLKLKEGVCAECKQSDGYFIQDSNCVKCHTSCKECSGPSQFECLACIDKLYFKKVDEQDPNSKRKCQECPDEGFFVKGNECIKCHDTCLKCHSQDSNGCDVCKGSLKFRIDKTCQECPTEKFYVDKENCLECFKDCKTCNGPQSNQCLICKDGLSKYYKDNVCIDCNKDNFWESKSDNICYDCHYSCQTCNGKNKENCTKCKSPFNWLDNLCESCPSSNYYVDQNTNKCIACHQSCEQCSSDQETDCLKCKNDAKFHTVKIPQDGSIKEVKYCKPCQINNGYFIKGDQCLECHPNCLTCLDESENKCTSCQQGLFLFEDGTCKSCPSEQYFQEKVNQISMCKQCSPNCLTCKQFGDDKCLTCKKDLYKNDLEKCEKCEISNKFFIQEDRCLHCHSTCKTCKDDSLTGCDKCDDGLSKMPDKTCQKCPQKGYFVEGEFCNKCHNTCEECAGGNQKQCKTCATGLTFWVDSNGDKFCVKCEEKIAHYSEGQNCKPCHPSCQECSGGDQSQCKKCVVDKYFKSKNTQGEGQCQECTGSYFIQGDSCLACHVECQACKGPQQSDCISCSGSLKFNKDKSKCINCRTDNGQFLNSDNICYDCDKSCKTCNGESNTSCLQCIDDLYFLQEDDNTKNKCKQCPSESYYIEPIDKKDCLKCDDSCLTCIPGQPKKCLKCKKGMTFIEDGVCQVCPELGFFVKDDKCIKCDSSCKKCSSESALNCTECHENNYFDLNDSNKCKQCETSNCYFIQNNKNCQKCNDSCQTCKDDTEIGCLTCKKDLYFKDYVDPSNTSKTIQKCENCDQNNGWFTTGTEIGKQQCKQCHDTCKKCSGADAKQCDECKNGLYFREGICQQCDISDGFFIKDKSCIKCSENCKTCSGQLQTECITCRINTYFVENTNECQPCDQSLGYYLDSNSKCFKCHNSCKTCNGGDDKSCTKCADKLSFLDGLCKTCDINNKYFIEESTNKCLQCHDTCQTCKGSGVNQCLSCRDKLTFDENKTCITCPPEGYYVDNFKCIKCHDSCKQCNSQLDTGCTQCQPYLFYWPTSKLCKICDIENGYFVKKESTGNFNQLCIQCHQDCKTCKDENQSSCIMCRETYSFKDQNDKNICKKCHSDCSTCNGILQTNCLECMQPGYHIRLDKTCGVCLSNQFLEDNHCQNCSDNCLKCNDYKICKECGNNTHIKQNDKCGECEQNEYADNATNKCMPCHETCLSCKGNQKNQCSQCIDGSLRIRTDTKECGKCDTNQYSDNFQCYDCHKDCKACSGPGNDIDQCSQCIDVTKYECNLNDLSYFAQNYYQKKQCEKKCLKCHENCSQCFGEQSNQCMKCKRMILQADFSCQRKCPERMFFDESDPNEVKCTNCDKNCNTCENQNKCQVCDQEYTLLEGQCYKCMSHQYLDKKLKKCVECDNDCKTCFDEGKQACIECLDPTKFFDQDNYCVSKCSEGYIKNEKTNRCQKCKYIVDQKNKSKICVVDCNKNQYLDPQTQICNDCQNNCLECQSLTKCTSCIQDYHFVSEKQEACRKCESNEYVSSKNVCKKCEFLNCLTCNENHCTKCAYKYILDENNMCKYDNRYEFYECTGLNKLDDSCEKEMQLIDKLDFGMKQSTIATYALQAISFFTIRSASVMSYQLQIQQQIGNSYMLQDSLKTLSLGPTFYEQNFQQNIINMIPNPFRLIPEYESYFYPNKHINTFQTFRIDSNLQNQYLNNNTSEQKYKYEQTNDSIYQSSQIEQQNLVQHLSEQVENQKMNSNLLRNLLQHKRTLSDNTLIQNNLRDVRSQQLMYNEEQLKYQLFFIEGIVTDNPFNKYFWFVFEFRKVVILLLQFFVPLSEISALLILLVCFSKPHGNQRDSVNLYYLQSLQRYKISKNNTTIPVSVNEVMNNSIDISQFSSNSSKYFEEPDGINELSIKCFSQIKSQQNIFQRYLQQCNSQQYFHPIYQRCEDCHPKCKGCTEYQKCKDCQNEPNRMQRYDQLADGFCGFCPDGQTWKPNNICNGCSKSCNCDRSNKQCISCKDRKDKLNVERNTCEPCKEDEGYYIDGQYCKKCNIICKTCQGPSENDCKDCIDGAKKFQDGSCKYNKDKPNDCILPYINVENICVCNQDGYYMKDKTCVECLVDLKCQRCSPETSCTQCYQTKPEKYLQDGKKCTDCKQSGYFINSNQITCDKCISNCDQCNNKLQCQKCSSDFYILEDDQSCSKCDQIGYYIDQTNQFCKQCPINCKKCRIQNPQCLECKDGYILNEQNKCIKQCGQNCIECVSVLQCTKCQLGYFLENQQCNQCAQKLNCLSCLNFSSCDSCAENKYIQEDGRCDSCGQGSFVENGKFCKKCKVGCSSCTEYSKCNECLPNYYKSYKI